MIPALLNQHRHYYCLVTHRCIKPHRAAHMQIAKMLWPFLVVALQLYNFVVHAQH